MPAVSLIRLPLAPEIAPELVPAETVRTVVPRAIVPPLRVAIEEVAPLRFAVPVVRVPTVATPPTVTVPPFIVVTPAAPVTVVVPPVTEEAEREPAETVPAEMAEVRSPTTVTVPPAMLPVLMVALLAKRVEPAPAREVAVIVPVAAVYCRLLAVVFALLIAPMLRSAAETVAVAVASRVRPMPDL